MADRISPLPTPPQRNDPGSFAARGDAFLAALPTFQAEANALADEVGDNADAAAQSATTATTKAAQTTADAAATAADRVQTGLDRAATAADRAAVESAIADGPVLSVNGRSGVVTGLVESDDAIFDGSITEAIYELTGTEPELNPSNGTIQSWTLTAASAPTESLASGQAIVLHVDGAGFGITWPSVTWKTDGGNPPELASGVVVPVVLWKVASTLYGARVGDA